MASCSASPRLLRNLRNAASCTAGLPMRDRSVRCTVSHSHVHATSCCGPQSLTSDRRDASITDLYSGRLIFAVYFARRNARTSSSSWKRCELEMFVTMGSKDDKTSFIHARELKPITAELKVNMSLKFRGTELFAPFWPLPASTSMPVEPRRFPEFDLTPNHPLRLRSGFSGVPSAAASFPGTCTASTAPSACCPSPSSSSPASSS
mmetsp:Transcript_89161/g.257035  ORF Transcript_89161/g.257035 Transcript_89161/m.257035 type:complete len:206 (-) Transcript_89161:8-625(-)